METGELEAGFRNPDVLPVSGLPSPASVFQTVIRPRYDSCSMVVFGIDPGSRVTGWGVISAEGNRLDCLGHGIIEAMPRGAAADFPSRLTRIYRGLKDLFAEYSPQAVAIEEIFHAANVSTALKLGHARGVAILAAAECGARVVEYSALEIKKSVTGYGRAEKSQVQMMVTTLLNLPEAPPRHDASDALAVAICHSLNGSPARRSRRRWKTLR